MKKSKPTSKNKSTKKVTSIRKKKSKMKDGFLIHENSPLTIYQVIEEIKGKRGDKKTYRFIMDGKDLGFDPARVPMEFALMELKSSIDNRRYAVEYNPKTSTMRYTSVSEFGDELLPIGYVHKLISDLKDQKNKAVINLETLKGTQEQAEAIKSAYNKAIMRLEGFLVKDGKLEFEERLCEYGNHAFKPSNSLVQICEKCDDEINADHYERKMAKEVVA